MSRLTHFSEAALANFARGLGITLPTEWHVALGSAATKGSFTELTGTGYGRVSVARSLGAWAGTQGDASVLQSTGTSHTTSNNSDIDFGVAASNWGTANFVGIFDAEDDGECWFWLPLPAPLVIETTDDVELAAGTVRMVLGLAGGMSDYLANKLIDLIFRGQAYTWPAFLWAGYSLIATSNASSGLEPNGGGYARVSIPSDEDGWEYFPDEEAPDRIGNAAQIVFPDPTGAQGTAGWTILKDASTAGNLMFHRQLARAKTIGAGSGPIYFDVDGLGISFS